MKKYLKKIKQSANFSNEGAMEPGDHFKNGASPKSHTIRRNHILNLKLFLVSLVVAVTMSIGLSSCDNNNSQKESPNNAGVQENFDWLLGTWQVSFPNNGKTVTLTLVFTDDKTVYRNGERCRYTIDSDSNEINVIEKLSTGTEVGTSLPYNRANKTLSAGHGYYYKKIPAEPEMVFVQGGTFRMGCTGEQGDC
jgi:hypothetical protein